MSDQNKSKEQETEKRRELVTEEDIRRGQQKTIDRQNEIAREDERLVKSQRREGR
jgi:hypothetical protein